MSHPTRMGLLAVVVALTLGCNRVEIQEMVPGGNVHSGQLECWLTLEFAEPPAGVDPTDVQVIFDSIALAEPAEFDWAYIASHDQVALGMMQGFAQNEETWPDADPPVAMPIKVKYPLRARPRLQLDTGDSLDLTATVYWGGKKVASQTRSVRHVYRSEGGGF